MKQYSVEVLRTAYRTVTVSVAANDAEEAKQIALNEASTVELSDEFGFNYEVASVEEDK